MIPMMFLTQLLPLIVFLVVDSLVTDVRVSIVCAVVFAIGQLGVTFTRSRRVDWFVVLDVLLIVALGALSIAFDNELFFKVKPAIIEAATILVVLGLLLAPDRFLLAYFGRLMPGTPLRPEAVGMMKSMLCWMCVSTAVHIGAVLFTAWSSSREVWALVAGPGFYLALLPMIGVAIGKVVGARRQANQPAKAPP